MGGDGIGGPPLDSHDFDDMGTRRFFKLGAKGELFFMLTTVLSAPFELAWAEFHLGLAILSSNQASILVGQKFLTLRFDLKFP